MKSNVFILFSLLIFSSVVMADEKVTEELKNAISNFLPDVDIDTIEPTPIEGFYQIIIDSEIIYITRDGRYVVKGDILDIKERRNLTEDTRAKSRINLIDSIKKDEYIEFTGKDAHDAIYVFTDIDCGYCRKLHRDVPELNARGISVRYLAYPRAGVDSAAGKEMSSVWCADNRQEALTAAKNRQSIEVKTCDDPVAEQYVLGQRMGVRGTPSIYLENGRNIPGYIPPDEILEQVGLD
jgi:thiol:disulfide interchange protein DsbC